MDEQKPLQDPPEVLAYQPGRSDSGRSYNRWWMVALRITGGIVAGIVSAIAGSVLVALTQFQPLLLAPPLMVFALFLFVAIRYRRFGYVTGLILSPFIVAAVVVILLIQLCSHP